MEEFTDDRDTKNKPMKLNLYRKTPEEKILELPKGSVKVRKQLLHKVAKPKKKLPKKVHKKYVEVHHVRLPKKLHRNSKEDKYFSINLIMVNRILASKIASCIKSSSQKHLKKIIKESILIIEESKK